MEQKVFLIESFYERGKFYEATARGFHTLYGLYISMSDRTLSKQVQDYKCHNLKVLGSAYIFIDLTPFVTILLFLSIIDNFMTHSTLLDRWHENPGRR